MRSSRRLRSERSVDYLTDAWLSDLETELRGLLPANSILSTTSALGAPTPLPPGLTLEMLSLRVFRVSLSTGVSLEQIDLHIDRSLEPVRATYRYEWLTGAANLNVNANSGLFAFVVECYRRFSS